MAMEGDTLQGPTDWGSALGPFFRTIGKTLFKSWYWDI